MIGSETHPEDVRVCIDENGNISANVPLDEPIVDVDSSHAQNVNFGESEMDVAAPQVNVAPPTKEELPYFDLDDFVDCARYGDVADVRAYLGFNTDGSLETGVPGNVIRRAILSKEEFNGNTALHMCCANSHSDILALFLPYLSGDDINVTNLSVNTPLHWASLNGHEEVCATLIKAGAKPQIRNASGHSALYLAEQQGHTSVADKILATANIN